MTDSVRMPGESCEIVLGHVIAKIVEQQKWVELFRVELSPSRPSDSSRQFCTDRIMQVSEP